MNFESFEELVEMCHYDEISVIAKDAVCMGKQIHFAAVLRNGGQAELCMLMQKETQTMPDQQQRRQHRQKRSDKMRNRELMKNYTECGISPKQLLAGDTCLVFEGMSAGAIHSNDLGAMMLFQQLAAAGWRLPKEHPFRKEEWENIELYRCQFSCPSGQLPQLNDDKMKITWSQNVIRHFIEKPFQMPVLPFGEHAPKEIPFTICDQNNVVRNGVCYIYQVTLTDPRKEQEETFADPEYHRKMLEYVTPEEFEKTKQELSDLMDQVCPRGMYYPVVEYECTLDLQLSFHTKQYLDAQPDCSGKAAVMMYKADSDKQTGPHGLSMKADLIQEPVRADLTQLEAELFEGYENIPEKEEDLRWI